MSKENEQPKIEKGIPIPAKRDKTGIATIMRALKKGDSFLSSTFSQSHASTYARYMGIKVTTRKQPDGKIRIWRIE